MDNADLRRGKPPCTKSTTKPRPFWRADALLTLAFEILADPRTHEDPKVRCNLVTALAKSSGVNGMVGGQMLDLMPSRRNSTSAPLRDCSA